MEGLVLVWIGLKSNRKMAACPYVFGVSESGNNAMRFPSC